jgi:tight adherence protein C
MTGGLLFASICLIAGGLLIGYGLLAGRRPALSLRLARAEGQMPITVRPATLREQQLPGWVNELLGRYRRDLRRAGEGKTLARFIQEKLMLAIAVPIVPLLPFLAAARHPLPPMVLLILAAIGFFVPDLALRSDIKKHRESIFLDLPDVISVMSLALRAGKSLRQAIQLAAEDCPGPLGQELTRALSLSRRERYLSDREALIRTAQDAGEDTFIRFTELLAAKESPYLEVLRGQAAQVRAEQSRYLDRAADRSYLAMHAPIAPLLMVMVLLFAYGFLHFLATTI